MKVKDLFKKLALRAGIADTEAKLTALVDALPDLDVDDDLVATPLTNNLITEAEAETRPTIKNKFTAQALNGVDALVDPVLGEIFDATELESFKTENKATTKKIAKLVARAKELKASSKPGDQSELSKTIEKLNNELSTVKTTHENEISTLKNQHATERFFDSIAGKVSRRTDVIEYAKAKEGIRVVNDFKDTLTAVGGVLDIKTGKVMQASDPTAQLFIDHKPVTADLLLEKTLTENEYIKKSDGPTPAGGIQVPAGQQQAGGNVSAAAAKMAASLKDD